MPYEEQAYLAANPDVAAAVARGQFKSGLEHYQQHGRPEGRRLQPPPQIGRPIFFCHLPKTAGTSLRLALEQMFRPHEIVPDRLMMQRQGGHYPPPDVVAATLRHQRGSVWLTRGHYHVALASLLENPIIIAILREPVARTISNLKHIARHGASIADIHRTLDGGKLPVEDNLMTRYLGGSEHDVGHDLAFLRSPIRDPDGLVLSAINRLPSIEGLGVVENMGAATARLNNLIGARLQVPRQNVSEPIDLNLSADHLEVIRQNNTLDQALYDAALSRLPKMGAIHIKPSR